MTAAVEILVANLKNVLSVPVQAVVEKGNKFSCWINTSSGPQRRPVVLGLSNNTRIEIKDGLDEGDEVLLNPRATIEEAREEEQRDRDGGRQEAFGDDKPAAVAKPDAGADAKGKAKGAAAPALDMKSLDKDKDGKISQDEAPDRMKSFFANIDTDSDGFIDAKELAALKQKMQQMQQQGGGPGGAGRSLNRR